MDNIIIDTENRKFFAGGDYEAYEVNISLDSTDGFVSIYEVDAKKIKEDAGELTIKWFDHMAGMLSCWAPIADRERAVRQYYRSLTSSANMYCGAPILTVIDGSEKNFATVALSDATNKTTLRFCVRDFEQQENVEFMLHLYEEAEFNGEYHFRLRIDERDIAYHDAIGDVTKWWGEFYPLAKPRTQKGEYPLYSTWYNYHQNPTQESLEKELEEAAKLGFKSIILDDGWSYEGEGPGDYRFCGNWKVCEEKFPDFQGFIDKAHSLGISVMVWFPVTLVGFESADYPKYKNKMLYNSQTMQCGVIDPRYPEIRDYVVNTYIDFVNKYNIDGLKLDFIDSLRILEPEGICQTPDPGRDCDSVTEGAARLMEQIQSSLTSQKTDFMIELRQRYVGPAITGYCNMLRVLDCAFDSLTNRIGIADLRMMNYNLAVHADMLLWALDETPVNCSKMLLNTMFGVPQISVLLQNSTDEQKALIQNYINYWYANREILLYGRLKAPNPQYFYTMLSSESDEKLIEVLYSENSFVFTGKTADVFNATDNETVYIENAALCEADASVYNCFGECVDRFVISTGVCRAKVPEGGRINVVNRE